MRTSCPKPRRGQCAIRVNERRFAIGSRVLAPPRHKDTPATRGRIKDPRWPHNDGWRWMFPNKNFHRKRYFISWITDARYW